MKKKPKYGGDESGKTYGPAVKPGAHWSFTRITKDGLVPMEGIGQTAFVAAASQGVALSETLPDFKVIES